MGRRTLRGGAKGYCKNDNRTSPGGFAERLGVQERDREGGDAMGQRAGRKSACVLRCPTMLVSPASCRRPLAVRAHFGFHSLAIRCASAI